MRPLWKGAISFGLVNIPVTLYSALKPKRTIDFDLLRDSDHSHIRYRKVSEADGKEVPREHIVKGYEYEKDQYVIVTDEDFQRVQIKSTQMVDIKEFVNLSEIDPRYFDTPYYLAPEKGGAKAYVLFRTALEQTGQAGIAKVVLRPPREHLAVLRPLDGILMLETMHFADELEEPSQITVPEVSVGRKELDMAVSLVNSMSGNWQPENYHDEYHDNLLQIIEQKVAAGAKGLPAPKARPVAAPGGVIDLVSILQQSLDQASKRARAGKMKSGKTAGRKRAA